MNLAHYQTLVFDCDGVVLDSNRVKTEAFRAATLPYGIECAQAMVDYHCAHGGVSRYRKFDYFLDHIVPPGTPGPTRDELLASYANEVYSGLLSCKIVDGLMELRKQTPSARWLIVSGGDQKELRQVFQQRQIDTLFDGGIFGSPDSKDDILAREKAEGNITCPALFFGDSRYDHQAARQAGLDFVFISQWTEFSDWQRYCSEHNIKCYRTLPL